MIRTLVAALALTSLAACTRDGPAPDASGPAVRASAPADVAPASASGDVAPASASAAATTDPYPGAPTSTAYPPGGAHGKVQYVILAASEPGEIHYTTDGRAPVPGAPGTRSGRNPVFWIRAGPGTTTVTFFAVDDAGNRGPVASATYEVRLP